MLLQPVVQEGQVDPRGVVVRPQLHAFELEEAFEHAFGLLRLLDLEEYLEEEGALHGSAVELDALHLQLRGVGDLQLNNYLQERLLDQRLRERGVLLGHHQLSLHRVGPAFGVDHV